MAIDRDQPIPQPQDGIPLAETPPGIAQPNGGIPQGETAPTYLDSDHRPDDTTGREPTDFDG